MNSKFNSFVKSADQANLDSSYPFKTKIFLRLLKSIKRGSLNVTLPDGSKHSFSSGIDGVHADCHFKTHQTIASIFSASDIALAEAYRDGHFYSTDLTKFLLFCIDNQQAFEDLFKGHFLGMMYYRLKHLFRFNSRKGSKKNIHAHYDLGNDFYKLWLDKTMTYSSGYFKNGEADALESSQNNKYQRIIDKLNLKSTDHILEIGCGWGGFATKAAKQTGCKVTCLTLSNEQHRYATELVKDQGLEHLIEVKICDYRDEVGTYDHIVSIEMIEAVGEQYWDNYFETIKKRLKTGGKAVIQSIYIIDDLFESYRKSTDFIQQFIFPGGMLPAPKTFTHFSKKHDLALQDFFSFGPDYAHTLNLWRQDFHRKIEDVKRLGFDEAFIKIWDFYYVYCEAGFISRRIDVAQIVLQKY